MTQLHHPHSVEYELTISSPLNQSLELSLMVVEINMYEDMFEGFMRIEVVLNDGIGLMDKYPIVGDETLEFKYFILQKEVFFETFKIYKVSNRTLTKAREHAVILHGITLPGYKNSLEYVYNPFINTKCDDIVFDMYYEYLTDFGSESKPLEMPVPTENKYTRVSSGQNPLQLINFIAAESKSSKAKDYQNASNYVFFEDSKQFNFVPISYLFNNSPIRDFFLNIPQDERQSKKGENTYPGEGIISMTFPESFDDLDSLNRGMYLNEVNIIDPILKRFKMHPIKEPDKIKHQFKYERDFDNLDHLPNSSSKTISPQSDITKGKKPYAAHRRMMITQYEKDNEKYPDNSSTYFETMKPIAAGDQLLDPRQRHKTLPESLHEFNNLFNHMVEVQVPGDPQLRVGQMITISVPQPSKFSGDATKFIMLYGQEATFLITAVRHLYRGSGDSYTMVLSCSKESFGQDPAGLKVV